MRLVHQSGPRYRSKITHENLGTEVSTLIRTLIQKYTNENLDTKVSEPVNKIKIKATNKNIGTERGQKIRTKLDQSSHPLEQAEYNSLAGQSAGVEQTERGICHPVLQYQDSF